MRDEQHNYLSLQQIYGLCKLFGRLAVKIAGCLIEDQQLWPLEQRSRDGNTLLLSARQSHTTLANLGLIALW
jgi:hypothetical protein